MVQWTADDAAHELMAMLPPLNRILAVELHQEAGEDTTMPQFRVMALLSDQPMTLSAVARLRRTSLQSAGELVQTLVARGWIVRTPDPDDRRQSLLALSDEGLAKYKRAQSRMLERLVPFLERLTSEEMEAVQRAIPALHRILVEENVGELSDGDR